MWTLEPLRCGKLHHFILSFLTNRRVAKRSPLVQLAFAIAAFLAKILRGVYSSRNALDESRLVLVKSRIFVLPSTELLGWHE
ncbi:uncharacterized protein STEHIDRAFT_130523 [Stereum hirsutum FP-91666 SS1]|uniref:uncharacterized protein n=1 Tax=Stereum hirsutum (strain FP-91666) TaxID=721885 RepID=UPI000440B5CD|nr:uncharacterized protein STEHIDRAFT_130523 [Stereum hirsutum FP-91666 SS1]EIM88620.1 hypothetical protein STEHIDRAFT_130523 [Stereum hirsutum FP-91666 SS1]